MQKFEKEISSNHRYYNDLDQFDYNCQPVHDYLLWSILNLIFCSLTFGGFAFYYSIRTRDNKRKNESLQQAVSYSKKAFVFNVVATLTGIVFLLFLSLFFAQIIHHR